VDYVCVCVCVCGRNHSRGYLNVFNYKAGGSIFLRKLCAKLPTRTMSKASTNDLIVTEMGRTRRYAKCVHIVSAFQG
jgi:hypothetical protein